MTNKKVDVFVGLDLSFNSSGINFIISDNKTSKALFTNFKLLLFNKEYKSINGVQQYTYNLPTNITVDNINLPNINGDYYQEDQVLITLKLTMAKLNVLKIINDKINAIVDVGYNVNKIVVSIEGFIMPEVIGAVQFRSLTGLIMMQGAIRSELIQKYKNKIYFNVVSPTKLKKFFSGNGSASKIDMFEAFTNLYDGDKLIDVNASVGKLNDVIDAFALNVNGYHKFYHPNVYNEYYGDIDELRHLKSKIKRERKRLQNKNKPKKNINKPIDFTQWLPKTQEKS